MNKAEIINKFRKEGYKINGILGKGGMAYVFSCYSIRDQKDLALKLFRPKDELDGFDEFCKENEIKIQNYLSKTCDNVLRVYRHSLEDLNSSYFLMDKVDGVGTLQDFYELHGANGSEEQRMLVMMEVGRIVHEVHKRGVLHLDLKFDNFFIRDLDDVMAYDDVFRHKMYIGDFGAAYSMMNAVNRDEDFLTGTYQYMSPEVLRGVKKPACDVFSFGVMLYEFMVGENIYWDDDLEINSDFLKNLDRYTLMPRINELGVRVQDVICRSIRHDYTKRYRTMEDMLVDMKKCI